MHITWDKTEAEEDFFGFGLSKIGHKLCIQPANLHMDSLEIKSWRY